jgi:murein tripeptide amidase MpaA
MLRSLALFSWCIAVVPAYSGEASRRAPLPPELPWHGKSEGLAVGASDPWVTPAEAAGFERTPRYDATVAWIRKLAAAAPEIKLVSLGKSPEGRDIWMVVASREGVTTPKALRAAGKPVLFVQAGIHSGEIDGKDAGLMLLRDMTVKKVRSALLDGASLLFVPILNVDGHERFSPFTRINQRGPTEAGWRTTSRNLNLNRDFTKLDAPETRSLVRALDEWDPDLYLDVHVTDGADYQYDITFGSNGPKGWSPSIADWLAKTLAPALRSQLAAMGHVPGPLIWPIDDNDLGKGIIEGTAAPRYSNGYSDARHLPGVLVETHSLKPYRQRVLGTYVLIETALAVLGREGKALRVAMAADRARRAPTLPLDFKPGREDTIEIAAVESRQQSSAVSGGQRVVWTGRPVAQRLLLQHADAPVVTASRPRAYWIPPAWSDVIERLTLHGVRVERISAAREVEVDMYRLADAKLAASPFEGRVLVTAAATTERRRETFAPGSVRVSTDQPLGDLAILLLEPASPDSFFQWGFFHEVLQPTEYAETYVMEPMAEAMMAEDPALKQEFEKAVAADSALAGNPKERLQWFYRRTPFFDERFRLYPVAREP